MNTNDLANRLKFLRAKANYTQSYVCSKIHLSRSSYSNYENGLRGLPGTERSLILCLLQKTDGKTLSHFFYNLLLL